MITGKYRLTRHCSPHTHTLANPWRRLPEIPTKKNLKKKYHTRCRPDTAHLEPAPCPTGVLHDTEPGSLHIPMWSIPLSSAASVRAQKRPPGLRLGPFPEDRRHAICFSICDLLLFVSHKVKTDNKGFESVWCFVLEFNQILAKRMKMCSCMLDAVICV